jgi:hypothetical protein
LKDALNNGQRRFMSIIHTVNPPVIDPPPLDRDFSFLFTPFFEDFSAAQPFLLQQVNNQLVHDFLSQ